MPKTNPKTDQPRRSSRRSIGPNRYKDEDAIRKKSTRSKPKRKPKAKLSPIAKRERKSKAKSTTAKRSRANSEPTRTRLRFNSSNDSDDNTVRIVLEDRDPKYTPKPATEPRSRRHKSIGPRVTVGQRGQNQFQLANIRARQKRQAYHTMVKMGELADKFNKLQTPGFKQRK